MSESKHRYKITIAYDGTRYSGWQVQPDQITVQGQIQKGLAFLTREDPHIMGSGRTDAGVHARGQVAHFDLEKKWSVQRIKKAVNSYLPKDIRINKVETVPSTFHAQKGTIGKEYRYFISTARVQPPFDRLYQYWTKYALDVDLMQQSANQLIGEHDFVAYSANPKREMDGTVRTIYRFDVKRTGSLITVKVCGSGFLYKMVRSLTGHLMRIGQGKEPLSSTLEILESKTRTARVESARPEGLFLWQVYYPGNEEKISSKIEDVR